jgi:hypothetical protein
MLLMKGFFFLNASFAQTETHKANQYIRGLAEFDIEGGTSQ